MANDINAQTSKCNYPIKMIKRNGTYIFFSESKSSLSVLKGGKHIKAQHSIEYYFENLPKYKDNIIKEITPYRNALNKISDEVKRFGGKGTIHGCIVDIETPPNSV